MGLAISFAVTAAVSEVDEPYVVTRNVLPKNTWESDVKLVPVTVSVNAAPPATTVVGLIVATVGCAAGCAFAMTARSKNRSEHIVNEAAILFPFIIRQSFRFSTLG
jgi:hypothetical protein